jgi:hypothetical protein
MRRAAPVIAFVDHRAGKPVGLRQMIGRPPIAASGNSDGDCGMFER